jgi:hypothetical protein
VQRLLIDSAAMADPAPPAERKFPSAGGRVGRKGAGRDSPVRSARHRPRYLFIRTARSGLWSLQMRRLTAQSGDSGIPRGQRARLSERGKTSSVLLKVTSIKPVSVFDVMQTQDLAH